ncbi:MULTISPECIES: hypothetical protein [unclassified Microcoleus]
MPVPREFPCFVERASSPLLTPKNRQDACFTRDSMFCGTGFEPVANT